MSTKSGFGHTEEELKLTSFYKKYKSAMDSLQPSQSVEGRKPTGVAKETPRFNISSEEDLKGASRVKRFLESKREAHTVESEPMLKRRRAKVVKNSGGILVSRELNKESFPAADIVRAQDWDSRACQKSLILPLDNFGFDDEGQKQTLVMRITVPKDSTTWAINICPRKHDEFMNVLFHFNPRQREKGGTLIQNDRKASTWKNAEKLSLKYLPALFGRTFDFAVQVNEDGFHTAVDTVYATTFLHRTLLHELEDPNSMILQVLCTDDYGNPEAIVVHQIYWGHKPAIPGLPTIGEEGFHNTFTPSSVCDPSALENITDLHIRNLPQPGEGVSLHVHKKLLTETLSDTFAPYGVESVKVFPNGGYGFVNLRDPVMANRAMAQLDGCELEGSMISISKAVGR
eukprot:285781_1